MSKQDGGSIEVSPSGVDTGESLEMKADDELKIEDSNDLQNSDIFRARGSVHSVETLQTSDLIWRSIHVAWRSFNLPGPIGCLLHLRH